MYVDSVTNDEEENDKEHEDVQDDVAWVDHPQVALLLLVQPTRSYRLFLADLEVFVLDDAFQDEHHLTQADQ